ncbi:MAG: glycerophosphodiester phosphodiesterase family protein [Hymenobacter sp.]
MHGHRGCRGLLPENTIPAFLHALRLGVDVLELDVVISQDQQVVVSHEPWLAAHLGPGPTGEPIDPSRSRRTIFTKCPTPPSAAAW